MADRFTDEERDRLSKGLCGRQTGYGLPHIEWCGNTLTPLERIQGHIECAEHELDNSLQGNPVLRLSYILKGDDAEPGMRVAEWDGSRYGHVRAVEGGTVAVEWDDNRTPKIPGNKGTRFLSTALECGFLVKVPTD